MSHNPDFFLIFGGVKKGTFQPCKMKMLVKMLSILKSLRQMSTTGRRLCAKHTFAFDSRITYSSGLPQIPGSGKDIAHLHRAISVAIPPQKKTKY